MPASPISTPTTGSKGSPISISGKIAAPADAPARSILNVRGPDDYFHADQGDMVLQLHVRDGRKGDRDRVQVQSRDDRLCAFEFFPASTRANFTPTVAMEFSETESASYAWTGLSVDQGESVAFEAMPEAKAVKCVNKSGRPARYTLTVNSADAAAGLALAQDFGPFDLPPGAGHVVALATWPELDAVRSELDLDGDSRTDRTELVLATPQPAPPTRFNDVPYSPAGWPASVHASFHEPSPARTHSSSSSSSNRFGSQRIEDEDEEVVPTRGSKSQCASKTGGLGYP
jgi:hypothetical protein